MIKKLTLKVIAGNHFGEEFVFEEEGAYIIGRSKYCALQIPNDQDMRISRQHLLLLFDSEKTRVRDLGSKNGTLINEISLQPGEITEHPETETIEDKELHPGDKVSIGNTVFLVEATDEDKSTPPSSIPIIEEEEEIIPMVEESNAESNNIPSPIPLVDSSVIKRTPVPPPVIEGEPTKEMPIPSDNSLTEGSDPDDTPTLPIKKMPKIDVEKQSVTLSAKDLETPPTPLKKEIDEKQKQIQHPQIPQKEKPVFELKPKESLKITEKEPPVPVPTKLKILPPESLKGDPSAQPKQRPVLEPELPTIVMDQNELEDIEKIDDTILQPPEKERKTSFTVKSAE